MARLQLAYLFKRKLMPLLLFTFCLIVGYAQSNQKDILKRNYTGLLRGNIKTFFSLQFESGNISGSYFYEKKGIDINLTGTIKGDTITMYELDADGKRTASIYGTLKGKTFTGKWQSLVSKAVYPLTLQQTTNEATALPTSIEGTYTIAAPDEQTDDAGVCKLTIIISKNKGEYYYQVNTSKRKAKGKIHFYRSLDEKSNYIIFDGLMCDEGCTKIEGLFAENEITIQNYGNAMNQYTKLGECDKKYIELQKQ